MTRSFTLRYRTAGKKACTTRGWLAARLRVCFSWTAAYAKENHRHRRRRRASRGEMCQKQSEGKHGLNTGKGKTMSETIFLLGRTGVDPLWSKVKKLISLCRVQFKGLITKNQYG